MTAAVLERPVAVAGGRGGAPARRAVVRWAWRLFRREWRRQALILVLLTLAVAATTMGLAVVSNVFQLKADPVFGTANTIITISDPGSGLSSDLAAARSQFGTIDVIEHQTIPVPGSVSSVDLRAADPNGPFVHATLRLDAGRFPTGPNQIAVTSDVAQTFGLKVGSVWRQGGRTWKVVGLVENPLNLLDQFALVAPGQANPPTGVSILINASQNTVQSFRLPNGAGVNIGSRSTGTKTAAQVLVLVLGTVGLLFVGLLAVAGFTVLAQRRLRALGTLGSLGATDRHVRLVMLANGAAVGVSAALIGTVVGLAGWLAFEPSLASITAHRIDRFALPWWAVGAAMLLAVVTAIAAAWWPARAVARIPVVAALSGRPPRPQPAHHFAALGGALLGAGLVLLAFADQHRTGFILGGIVVTVLGVLLLAPLAIRALAATASRVPISIRLALRDLARYQARSGAALAAIALAIGIAATIAVSASAAQSPPVQSNLPDNQLILYLAQNGAGNPIPPITAAQQEAAQNRVNQLAAALHAQAVVPLYTAVDSASGVVQPAPEAGGGQGGYPPVALAQVTVTGQGQNVSEMRNLYVATPAVLAHYGIAPSRIEPGTDIIASRAGIGNLQIFDPTLGPSGGRGAEPGSSVTRTARMATTTRPSVQTIDQLPDYTSAPTDLITTHAVQALGLEAIPSGWLVQTPGPLTVGQIDTAQKGAAAAGLYVETKSTQKSLAGLRNWSTTAGILVALGVLGMTVGLIRSETANDLRTLSATGASSTTRRTLTGATAAALALLGALLGTAGAYLALLAWHRSNLNPLTNVPAVHLVVILVGLPLIAGLAGWLLAGREPGVIVRRPIE
jgi:putative ABC transport system permease protein